MTKHQTKSVTIRLPAELVDRIVALAAGENRSVNNFLLVLLTKTIRAIDVYDSEGKEQ